MPENEEHKLRQWTQWSRSHSGQDFYSECSCGKWKRKGGGSHQNFHAFQRQDHEAHIKEATQ